MNNVAAAGVNFVSGETPAPPGRNASVATVQAAASGRIWTLLLWMEQTPLPAYGHPLPAPRGEGIGKSHGSSVKMHPYRARREFCGKSSAGFGALYPLDLCHYDSVDG